jgi:pimeloyl-ACP methyl ester carboxylesterase
MDEVQNINYNALIIVGKSDLMTPVKYSRYLAEKIPNSELHVIEKAGHSVMLEQHAEVNRWIQTWAKKLA